MIKLYSCLDLIPVLAYLSAHTVHLTHRSVLWIFQLQRFALFSVVVIVIVCLFFVVFCDALEVPSCINFVFYKYN